MRCGRWPIAKMTARNGWKRRAQKWLSAIFLSSTTCARLSSDSSMHPYHRVRSGRRNMTQTKFLITGATGATGGNTARQLLEKQHAVRALAHRPDERSEQLQK